MLGFLAYLTFQVSCVTVACRLWFALTTCFINYSFTTGPPCFRLTCALLPVNQVCAHHYTEYRHRVGPSSSARALTQIDYGAQGKRAEHMHALSGTSKLPISFRQMLQFEFCSCSRTAALCARSIFRGVSCGMSIHGSRFQRQKKYHILSLPSSYSARISIVHLARRDIVENIGQ